MYKVELYVRVRRACMVEGMSTREAARVFGLHRDTVRKMLEYSVPHDSPERNVGYRLGLRLGLGGGLEQPGVNVVVSYQTHDGSGNPDLFLVLVGQVNDRRV